VTEKGLGVNQEGSTTSSQSKASEPLPRWVYRLNAFEEAVRHVESCECESMPCHHVIDWKAARAALVTVIGEMQKDVQGWTRECYRASARAGAFRGCCEVADSVIDNTNASGQSAVWHETRDWYVKARQSANELYAGPRDDV
jgi:hypothetical protein